ncbi:TlpA family protein disulfide reductase [Chachezhania sediminis]|uniref:TlpA family protein disulfide reductase n=1 Tax=Chachezhania sediminis TaxID=2599291 RepID=UPI00131CD5CA|nr:TlpA disulfide reductase family protein [Chachezhania sediminis]
MRLVRSAALYLSIALGANAAAAADIDTLEGLRDGDLKKLTFADPKPVPDIAFFLPDGSETTLEAYRGKYVLVNFWATWCAPCRKEMPELNALQQEFGGDRFEVLTIATGRNSPAGINKFFAETDITALPKATDPKSALAREMGVLGLPITVLIDPDGNEIARLMGDAAWHSDSARAIAAELVATPEG